MPRRRAGHVAHGALQLRPASLAGRQRRRQPLGLPAALLARAPCNPKLPSTVCLPPRDCRLLRVLFGASQHVRAAGNQSLLIDYNIKCPLPSRGGAACKQTLCRRQDSIRCGVVGDVCTQGAGSGRWRRPRQAPRSCPAASWTAHRPQQPAARLPAPRALRDLRDCPAALCAR